VSGGLIKKIISSFLVLVIIISFLSLIPDFYLLAISFFANPDGQTDVMLTDAMLKLIKIHGLAVGAIGISLVVGFLITGSKKKK
jgi:hypothetical protein